MWIYLQAADICSCSVVPRSLRTDCGSVLSARRHCGFSTCVVPYSYSAWRSNVSTASSGPIKLLCLIPLTEQGSLLFVSLYLALCLTSQTVILRYKSATFVFRLVTQDRYQLGEVYYWLYSVVNFLFPFVSILIMNIVIIYTLHKRSTSDIARSGAQGQGQDQDQTKMDKKYTRMKNVERQIFKTLLLLTSSFLVLNAPGTLSYFTPCSLTTQRPLVLTPNTTWWPTLRDTPISLITE